MNFDLQSYNKKSSGSEFLLRKNILKKKDIYCIYGHTLFDFSSISSMTSATSGTVLKASNVFSNHLGFEDKMSREVSFGNLGRFPRIAE